MELLILILLIVALGCFLWAAFARTQPRINLVALGLAAWVLAVILGGLGDIDINVKG